jgi:hypothetical protein
MPVRALVGLLRHKVIVASNAGLDRKPQVVGLTSSASGKIAITSNDRWASEGGVRP